LEKLGGAETSSIKGPADADIKGLNDATEKNRPKGKMPKAVCKYPGFIILSVLDSSEQPTDLILRLCPNQAEPQQLS
jgi:hypothetical protein